MELVDYLTIRRPGLVPGPALKGKWSRFKTGAVV
ncbi:hypothetical protein LP7551_01376 [Roseibium album]|nr:hypothetical protein LP7551_01376 [Roseibium album]